MFFAEEQDHLCFKKGLGCRKKTFCFWFVFDKKKPFHSITTHEMSVKRKNKKNKKKKKKRRKYMIAAAITLFDIELARKF